MELFDLGCSPSSKNSNLLSLHQSTMLCSMGTNVTLFCCVKNEFMSFNLSLQSRSFHPYHITVCFTSLDNRTISKITCSNWASKEWSFIRGSLKKGLCDNNPITSFLLNFKLYVKNPWRLRGRETDRSSDRILNQMIFLSHKLIYPDLWFAIIIQCCLIYLAC